MKLWPIFISLLSLMLASTERPPTLSSGPSLLAEIYPESGPTLIGPGLISTPDGEYSPTYDARRGELYFMRRKPGQYDYQIFVSYLQSDTWSVPRLAFSGQKRDAAPYLSPDGNTLFFDSRRSDPAVAGNSINLWYTRRSSTGWEAPTFLAQPSANTEAEPEYGQDEFGPAIDGNGVLYFYSFRRPHRGGKRYLSLPDTYQQASLLETIPDPSAKTFVSYLYISPDATLAIMEGKAKGRNDTDLFWSKKLPDGSWSEALELPLVNTRASEGGPFISSDGKYLFFTSNRRTEEPRAGNANLYLIKTAELGLAGEFLIPGE